VHNELYRKGIAALDRAKKLKAADKIWSGYAARFMHPTRREQLFIAAREKGKYLILQVSGGAPYWVSQEGTGIEVDGKFVTQEVPIERAAKLLNESELIPYPERLYGLYESKRIVALVYVYQNEDDGLIHSNTYVLRGESRPKIDGHDRLDLKEWWAAVDRGKLKDVVKIMKSDPRATWSGTAGRGAFVLAEGTWTGAGAMALYLSKDARNITPEEADKLKRRNLCKLSYEF